MGAPLEIRRTEYTALELRGLSSRCADGAQVRRILAIAMVLEGRSRTEAAELNGMDRQTLRDWVHRYNALGPAGLKSRLAPGQAALLTPFAASGVARSGDRRPRSNRSRGGALAVRGLARRSQPAFRRRSA